MHDYSLHTNFYRPFLERLYYNNCNVYGFDFEGFGNSDGMRADIREFDYFIDDIRQFFDLIKQDINDVPIIFAGHGLGAITAIIAQRSLEKEISGLLLMGPLFQYSNHVPKIIQDVARYVSGVAGTFPILSLDSDLFSHDFDVLEQIESDELIYNGKLRARMASHIVDAGKKARQEMKKIQVPTLLLHGKKDKLTRPRIIERIEEKLDQSNLKVQWVTDAGHTLMLENGSGKVVEAIRSWTRELL